jgi:hypothetical protein
MEQEKLETRRVRCLSRRDEGENNVTEEIQVLFESFLDEMKTAQEVPIGSKEFFLMFKGILFGEGYDSFDYRAWTIKQNKHGIGRSLINENTEKT